MESAQQSRDGIVGVSVTREVRWFLGDGVPSSIAEWFSSGDVSHERRRDVYDVELARLGVGAKRRSTGSVDAKYLLSYESDVDLDGGVRGRVEDWVKISTPVSSSATALGPRTLPIDKAIRTHRYRLEAASNNGSAAPVGCDIELVLIRSGSLWAWSLCLETLGTAQHRTEALQHGVAGLLRAVSPRDRALLTSEHSYGYPAWIARSCSPSRVDMQ